MWSMTLKAMDRFGRLYIGPDGIGLNEKHVRWDRIEEIRVRDTVSVILDATSERLADRIADLVPRFVPARGYLTSLVVGSVFGMTTQVAQLAFTSRSRMPMLIPFEIIYRGRLGQRNRVEIGIFALLIAALVPEVNQSIATTASHHKITASIEQATPAQHDFGHRAQLLLQRAQTMSQRALSGRRTQRFRAHWQASDRPNPPH
jgi:hypothetical protein